VHVFQGDAFATLLIVLVRRFIRIPRGVSISTLDAIVIVDHPLARNLGSNRSHGRGERRDRRRVRVASATTLRAASTAATEFK